MSEFKSVVVVRQPVETLWTTVRDRLPELAPMIDDLESVALREREALAPGELRLVNEWRAKQRVPEPLRRALRADAIGWIDRNVWRDGERRCDWEIEPYVLADRIRCEGCTLYEPALGGRGSRVTFEGRFELAAGALAELAGPLERPLAAFVESIVTILIPRNLRKVLEAAGSLAVADPRAGSAEQQAVVESKPRIGERR